MSAVAKSVHADGNTEEGQAVILQMLAEQTELIVNLEKQGNKIEEARNRIESKVDEIDRQIKELSVRISAYQSLVERNETDYFPWPGSMGKMDEVSQMFLVSAKVMYDHLIVLGDIIDYSGVCVLVTKALEVEMDKRFYTEFLNFLDRRYHQDYSQYHTTLLYKKAQ